MHVCAFILILLDNMATAIEILGQDSASLSSVLQNHDFALCLSPGFFRFYGHMGVLNGLYEHNALRATHVSGSSAGAMVASFYAAGMSPPDMVVPVLSITRGDFWDLGGFGGLLKGYRFQDILSRNLPVKAFEECSIPCGVTAFDIVRFRTNYITTGCIATAVRASCTFPGLFQPVMIDGTPHIDGGVFDGHGLMALPGVPASNLIVNVMFEGSPCNYRAKLPSRFHGAALLSIIVRGVPGVHPFSMQPDGPRAYESARRAIKAALTGATPARIEKIDQTHFLCYVDAISSDVTDRTIDSIGGFVSETTFASRKRGAGRGGYFVRDGDEAVCAEATGTGNDAQPPSSPGLKRKRGRPPRQTSSLGPSLVVSSPSGAAAVRAASRRGGSAPRRRSERKKSSRSKDDKYM